MDGVCSSENCQNLRIQNKLLKERIQTLEKINKTLVKKLNFEAEKTSLNPIKSKLKIEEVEIDHVDCISTQTVKKEKVEDSKISFLKVDVEKMNVIKQECAEKTVLKDRSVKEELHSEEHEYFEEGMNVFGYDGKGVDQLNRSLIKMESE